MGGAKADRLRRTQAGELAGLWGSLRQADAAKAYKAIMILASTPNSSVPFLRGKLTHVDPRFKQWLQDLNGNLVDAREKAVNELTKEDGSEAPALRQALDSNLPPELRPRLQNLLDEVKNPTKVSEDVRAHRALEALERAGDPQAVTVLEALANEGPGAPLKQQAKAALMRLKRQAAAP